MEKIKFPLEQHNRLKFFVTTHPNGCKFFFDNNGFLYIKDYLCNSNHKKTNKIIKNVSDVLMRDCFLSEDGDYKFLIQEKGKSKIFFEDQYLVLNKGDALIFKKDLKIKHERTIIQKIFGKCNTFSFYTREYKYPDRKLL